MNCHEGVKVSPAPMVAAGLSRSCVTMPALAVEDCPTPASFTVTLALAVAVPYT